MFWLIILIIRENVYNSKKLVCVLWCLVRWGVYRYPPTSHNFWLFMLWIHFLLYLFLIYL